MRKMGVGKRGGCWRNTKVGESTRWRDSSVNAGCSVKDANKKLFGAAKAAGVKRYGTFQDSGYKGLYGGLGRDDIKRVKGIAAEDDLLDCIDREELAANEFRITQTEAKLKRDGTQGEQKAIDTHFVIGQKARRAIEEIKGTMPEKLSAVPSIKKLADKQKKDTHKLEAGG